MVQQNEYSTVSLSPDLIEKIDSLVEKDKRDLNSRPDVIAKAIDFYIENLDKEES